MQERTSSFRFTPHLVLGLIIVVVGVLLTLDNLEVLDAREYLRYWPALLMVYGIVKMLQPDSRGSRYWGLILTFVGAALLVDKLYILDFRLWDFWPLLLVALGAMMILKTKTRPAEGHGRTTNMPDAPTIDTNSVVNASAILGGSRRNVHTNDFRGGELTAVMGGCDIDLRNASITTNPAVIDVFAFWGGIAIKVPQTWSVSFEGTPVLGGYDDKTFRQGGEGQQRLIIRGTVVMGGVEVSN